MPKLMFILFLSLISITGQAQNREVPFTQEDKERLIRYEEKFKAIDQRFESLEKNIDQRFNTIEGDIDSLKNLIYILIGSIFAVFIGMVGFIAYDRGQALQPIKRENHALSEENKTILNRLAELEKKLESRAG